VSGAAPAFPWEEALHAGLCRMRLPAKDFWALTPRELGFSLGLIRPSPTVPDRKTFDALMRAFPDDTFSDERE
jgi:uncharacterized phage protein (TIGR02216 family)